MTKTFETFYFRRDTTSRFSSQNKKRERNSRKSCTNKRYEEFLGLLVHRAKSLYLSLTLCRVLLIYVLLRACDCARLTSTAFSTFRQQNLALTQTNRFMSFCVHSSFRKWFFFYVFNDDLQNINLQNVKTSFKI